MLIEPMIFSFTTACVVMGIGIGTDVVLATLMRASTLQTSQQKAYWLLGVTATHTLFPMFGYLTAYLSITLFPVLTPLIGLIAFGLISHFLWQEIFAEGDDNEANHRATLINLTLIIAISWDALWSGPAKSAQVIGWPDLLIWLSFAVVGLIVLILATSSLMLSKRLSLFNNAKWMNIGLWLQYSIIAYFGILALTRYTLSIDAPYWLVMGLAALTMYVVMSQKKISDACVI